MGSGMEFSCSKCRKHYSISVGVGFAFPGVYQQIQEAVKAGEYGEEWKNIATSEPVVADAERYVHICEKCGHWEVKPGLTLYTPKQGEVIEEDCYFGYTLKAKLRIRKEYTYSCEKCGGAMHKATLEEIEHLKCPRCGGERDPKFRSMFLWD